MWTFNIILDHADPTKLNQIGKQGLGLPHLLLQRERNDRDTKLKALLDRGVNPNLCTEAGIPTLSLYVMENQIRCVDILLQSGADVNQKNKDGFDLALTAAATGFMRVLRYIHENKSLKPNWDNTCLTKFNTRQPDGSMSTMEFNGTNALHLAAFHGHDSVIEFYLENNLLQDLEVAALDECFRALHFAALSGWSSCIRILAERGACVTAVTKDKSSALHIAVRANHLAAVKTLIELGLAIDTPDSSGTSPLVYALKQGKKDIADALLSALPKASVDFRMPEAIDPSTRRSKYLSCALDTAIRHADIALCRVLWTAGCSLQMPLPSCRGCTPLMAALGQNRTEIALWMLGLGDVQAKRGGLDGQCNRHFAFGQTSLHIACGLQEPEEVLEKLLKVYLEIGSNWLLWPLGVFHVCASRNNTKSLKFILKYVRENEDALR
ncbi:ankyrin repeat-containing domain protein [Xylariales sp. PMI_506]|nr:ankyrin repeat-containing domain protein [Xylariales sp. PMI_506]